MLWPLCLYLEHSKLPGNYRLSATWATIYYVGVLLKQRKYMNSSEDLRYPSKVQSTYEIMHSEACRLWIFIVNSHTITSLVLKQMDYYLLLNNMFLLCWINYEEYNSILNWCTKFVSLNSIEMCSETQKKTTFPGKYLIGDVAETNRHGWLLAQQDARSMMQPQKI